MSTNPKDKRAENHSLRIVSICHRILSPVTGNARFFTAALLICCAVPWVFALTQGAKILWLIAMTTLQGVALAYILSLISLLLSQLLSHLFTSPSGRRATSRVINTLLLLIPATLLLTDVGSIAMTGQPVDIDSVNLMLETTTREAGGFFTQYLTVKATLIMLSVLLIITAISLIVPTAVRHLRRHASKHALMRPYLQAAAIAMAVIGGLSLLIPQLRSVTFNNYNDLLIWASQTPDNPVLIRTNRLRLGDPLSKWLYIYKDISLQNQNIAAWEECQAEALSIPVTPPAENEFDIIIVIGESFIRQHSPLYGYYLNTTPRLKEQCDSGRLVVFSDMITAANFTTASLRNFLNLNDLSEDETWYNSVYFPLLIKKAGWNVYHYDNQTVSRTSDAGIGRMIYSPVNLSEVYDGVSDSIFNYDGDYLSYIDRKLIPREKSGRKLVIYHLWGQHFPASDRFPGTPRFDISDITSDHPWLNDDRRREIAAYDSATYYNDSIVNAIIDSRRDRPTILIYFSDHGEDSWELAPVEARNRPMPQDRAWLDRQYHIPFMVWMSDSLRQQYPAIEQRIRSAADRSAMLDNLGQMILGMAGITTPLYRPERDITSPHWHPRPRVTAEGYHYDDSPAK
ncbi:MAG: phosphoethanolamine transferase [Muribaculaceae bacterium]|nr:phosphoethanolamine transferase [Muribaculaceae bacterium]